MRSEEASLSSPTGALRDMSGPESRASIRATSSRETPMAVAMRRWISSPTCSSVDCISRARRRRRLKNSAFWADEVPPRTIDQLRRM